MNMPDQHETTKRRMMLETDTYQSRAKAKNNNDDHDDDDPITVSELFHAAEHKLPKQVWNFYFWLGRPVCVEEECCCV